MIPPQIQQSELIILVLAVAFLPLMVRAYRGIDLPGKRWLAAMVAATLVAYVATIAEGFVLPEPLNVLEHASFAVAGVCLARVAFELSRYRIGKGGL